MNCYLFSRSMEYTASAYLKQIAYGETPEEAFAALKESGWEFDDNPSIDEDAGAQTEPIEILEVNYQYLRKDAPEEEIQEARRWNEKNYDNG